MDSNLAGLWKLSKIILFHFQTCHNCFLSAKCSLQVPLVSLMLAFVTFEAKRERLRPRERGKGSCAGRQEERKEEATWVSPNEVGRMGPGVAPITSYVTHLTRRT